VCGAPPSLTEINQAKAAEFQKLGVLALFFCYAKVGAGSTGFVSHGTEFEGTHPPGKLARQQSAFRMRGIRAISSPGEVYEGP